jgi:hypothetical protein
MGTTIAITSDNNELKTKKTQSLKISLSCFANNTNS